MGLVQTASGSTTGTALTLTFPSPVFPGSAVIIALAGYYGGSISGFTVGGTAVTFTKVATSGGYNAEIWACYSVPASSATVTVTASTAGILAWAYEVYSSVALDQAAGTHSSGTSWNSGTTAATIPYQHFAVGLGAVFGSSAAVTPAGSGWVNEAAYSNVRGASTVGAVSGYQQPSSPGTYSYSGTTGSSSAWGAVTAVFLAVPPPAQFQTAWGGYSFTEHAAAGYTGVSATFTVPSCSGGPDNSFWVGLGNVNQVGIFLTYDSSAPGGATARCWTWWLPGAGEAWNQDAFPVAVGDSLTLSMQVTATYWLMTIANNTEGWSYTETRSVLATNIGSVSNLGTGPAQWPFPLGGAEVVVEKEFGVNLDYGPCTFTSITTTPAATEAPAPMFTVNANIDQYPGPYTVTSGEGSFTMYYNAPS